MLKENIKLKFKKCKEKINIKILLSIFCILGLFFSYIVLNYNELVSVYHLEKKVDEKLQDMELLLGGEAIGIKLLATGVLVMGIDREDTKLQIGDIILKANDEKIESNTELMKVANASQGKALSLEVKRKEDTFVETLTPKWDELSQEYKLGLWVKDSSAGVGTVTFYEKKYAQFASLGHAVTETKDNMILPIITGGITKTSIYSIKKGIAKVPGELKGSITNEIIGEIKGNTEKGIFGTVTDMSWLQGKRKVEILPKSKIKEGDATIFCTLDDNKVKEYHIQIEKVLLTSNGNKNMIIHITDEELLNKTGGIIQGMSGSPILQEGKLIGAVTHVFLNDPTRGYGVFIENMIEDMCSIE